MQEDHEKYNIYVLKNIDDEDFVFAVDKVQYMIPAGETRNFPKFMAALAIKHLIDKVIQKEDPEGRKLGDKTERDRLGALILVGEDKYEKPQLPTDAEIVDDMNRPSDMERILEKNKKRLKSEELPVKTTGRDKVIPAPEVEEVPVKVNAENVEEEKFEGLEEPETKELPSREEMLDYAKNTLKMNVDHHKAKERISKLSDEELYAELQMGE